MDLNELTIKVSVAADEAMQSLDELTQKVQSIGQTAAKRLNVQVDTSSVQQGTQALEGMTRSTKKVPTKLKVDVNASIIKQASIEVQSLGQYIIAARNNIKAMSAVPLKVPIENGGVKQMLLDLTTVNASVDGLMTVFDKVSQEPVTIQFDGNVEDFARVVLSKSYEMSEGVLRVGQDGIVMGGQVSAGAAAGATGMSFMTKAINVAKDALKGFGIGAAMQVASHVIDMVTKALTNFIHGGRTGRGRQASRAAGRAADRNRKGVRGAHEAERPGGRGAKAADELHAGGAA